MEDPKPILSVENLRVTLGTLFGGKAVPVLEGVSFELPRGKSLALLGRTGSGKSVLLRAMTRFFHGLPIRQVDGSVTFEGQNLLKASQGKLFQIRGTRISHVLQNAHALFNPQLTIRQHFELLLQFNRPAITDRIGHATQFLYRVGIVDPERMLEHRCYPDELDTATRQKIMIASALCGEPDILLADEPVTEFDSSSVALILDLFEKLKKERGMSILTATGRVRRAEQFGDQIAILEGGRIVETAPPKQIFDAGKHLAARAFGEGTLLAGAERQRLISHLYS